MWSFANEEVLLSLNVRIVTLSEHNIDRDTMVAFERQLTRHYCTFDGPSAESGIREGYPREDEFATTPRDPLGPVAIFTVAGTLLVREVAEITEHFFTGEVFRIGDRLVFIGGPRFKHPDPDFIPDIVQWFKASLPVYVSDVRTPGEASVYNAEMDVIPCNRLWMDDRVERVFKLRMERAGHIVIAPNERFARVYDLSPLNPDGERHVVYGRFYPVIKAQVAETDGMVRLVNICDRIWLIGHRGRVVAKLDTIILRVLQAALDEVRPPRSHVITPELYSSILGRPFRLR